MTRLTLSATGDPFTFRPVTSSIVRKSKDGNVDVIIMLFGSHYNISMNGILQQNSSGDIDTDTQSIDVDDSYLELDTQKKTAGGDVAELIGSFSSFMYFYPGLKIKGNLKLDSTSSILPVPMFRGSYQFKDLLGGDELIFRLTLQEDNLLFEVVEIVDTVETVVHSEELDSEVDSVFFEFEFNVNGKSRLYLFEEYGTLEQVKTRKWFGNLKAQLGECNVSVHNFNDTTELKKVSSDFLFLEYPQIFMKFDRTVQERFTGQVKMFDDNNSVVESEWLQIRSRDYKFVGNRIIENGMIRIIVKTNNPNIEIWGWNYNLDEPRWERTMVLEVSSDDNIRSFQLQNIKFEYFTKLQVKCDINFGTSLYSILMTRGDPYITMLNKGKLKFKLTSGKDRMGADFTEGNYSLLNTSVNGSPAVRNVDQETLSGYSLKDNYFGFYNSDSDNEVVGWMSNILEATEIEIVDKTEYLEYTFTYPRKGNIFGIGVLPSYSSNLVGGIPLPFVIANQDEYIKWRANEALLSFREVETFKRR